ncbi:MAG: protein kinase [Phycisphaerae bacterium]|jgi:serine/threonine protein kinase
MRRDGPGNTATCHHRLDAAEPQVDRAARRDVAGRPPSVKRRLQQRRERPLEVTSGLQALRAIQAAQREAARRAHALGSAVRPAADNSREDLAFLRAALTDYAILEPIRYGGQGAVYRARHLLTKRVVAIKILRDGPLATDRQRARFEREAELTSRLQHPNIVTLYEYGFCHGRPFLALECIEGLPINDYVLLNDLSPRQVAAMYVKVCRAVHHAHQHGIIHRDLSPANILVDESGEPHILDLGLAQDTWADDGSSRISGIGQIVGTLPYLSPEQVDGLDSLVDVRSDVYALGVVLYELLVGRLPYTVTGSWAAARNTISSVEPVPLRQALKQESPDRLPDSGSINRDLEIVLQKALAKSAAERYQSAADLADDVQRYAAGEAVSARAGHHLYMLRKSLRRYRVAVFVVCSLTLVLMVSSAAIWHAWLVAVAQRDRAREATSVAYNLFEHALEADTNMGPLAGSTAFRDHLLGSLSQAVPQLATLVDDESLRMSVTERQGDLALEQGQRAAAAGFYRAFLDTTQRQYDADPTNPESQLRLLRAHRKLASVSDNPELLYRCGIDLGERLVARELADDDLRQALGELHINLGESLFQAGDYVPALEHFERVFDYAPLGVQDPAKSLSSARLQAQAASRQGQIQLKLGDHEQGRESLLRSLRMREQLVQDYPAHTGVRHELMLAYMYVSSYQRDTDRSGEAVELLRSAIATGQLLCDLDPTVVAWKQNLCSTRHRLARIYLDQRQADESLEQCDLTVALADELAQMTHETPEALTTLALALVLQGRAHLARSTLDEAYASFRQSADICETLVAANPSTNNVDYLASSYTWLASARLKQGKVDEAIAHRERAMELRDQLAAQNPEVVELELDAIETRVNLGVAYQQKHQPQTDSAAERAFTMADNRLAVLWASGRLAGYERRYQVARKAIEHNRGLLPGRSLTVDSVTQALTSD